MAKFRKSWQYKFDKYALKTMGRAFGYVPGLGLDYLQHKGIPVGVGWPDYLAKKTKNLFWRKPWGRSRPGHYIGSARPIYGSAPPRKGPVYGSNPKPPVYGSDPRAPGGPQDPNKKRPDPVAYKMEFLTPVINPIEKWHKGRMI